MPALEKRREDLLAAIAAGEAKEDALKKLDAEIEAASARVADKVVRAEETMDRSGATLRGLQSRLDAALAKRDRLTAMTPEVLSFTLRSEIEEAGEEYRRHAEQVVSDFTRLMGLGAIMESIDRSEAGRTGYRQGRYLRLPKFNLDVFEDLTRDTGRRYLFDAEHNLAYRAEGAQAERQRLTEQGVRLP
jgi:hypothetical protein